MATTGTSSPLRTNLPVTVPVTRLSAESQAKINSAAVLEKTNSAQAAQAREKSQNTANVPPRDDASTTTKNITATGSSSNPLGEYSPMENPLHQYATYTYGITLYMLSSEEYEDLQTRDSASLQDWHPKFVLISSAGKYNSLQTGDAAGRLPEFTDDFYFENFKMTTVVGLNSQTRGTNAIDISFTIIEPYGLTLLDRLISASTGHPINSQNYLSQPYLLELDFYGANDLGDPSVKIHELKKRFPVKLVEFKIKASTRGAEYAVRAIPFSHNALLESAAATPVNLEVTASNLGNFFAAVPDRQLSSQIADRQEQQRKESDAKKQEMTSPFQFGNYTRKLATQDSASQKNIYTTTPYNVKSYTAAVNDWNKLITGNTGDYQIDNSVVGKTADVADTIEVVFSGFEQCGITDIENSKVVLPELSIKSQPMYGVQNVNAAAASQDSAASAINTSDVHVFNINAGTSIIDVINLAMRSSDYIKRQLVDANGNKNFADNTVVHFYKIIPQIKKLSYDKIRKRYATATVYHVVYYSYFNTKHPNLPYVTPTSAVKEYSYIYTGKNLDILDFTIDFDAAYFTTVVALPGNVNSGNNQASVAEGNVTLDPYRSNTDSKSLNQVAIHSASQDMGSGAVGVRTGEEHLVANAISSIYSNARGDMVNVKLKIVGDPQFIKQDDLYTSPGNNMPRNIVTTNGSIAMDFSDIFCWISFRTPSDINEATGLVKTAGTGDFADSKFSGFYKIITVDSEFYKGQFTQTLTCIRMQIPEKKSDTKERKEAAVAKTTAAAAASGVRMPETGGGAGRGTVNITPAQVAEMQTGLSGISTRAAGSGVIDKTVVSKINPNTLLPVTATQIAAQPGLEIKQAITPRRGAGFK
jgi:hypothetical protein